MTSRLLLAPLCAALILSGCLGIESRFGPPTPRPAVAIGTAEPSPSPPTAIPRAPETGSVTPVSDVSPADESTPPTTTLVPVSAAATIGALPSLSAPTVTEEAPPPAAEVPREFSGELAKQTVETLSGEIGSRPVGSASQARAAEFLRASFEALGYDTRLQEFTVSSYVDRGSSLRLVRGRSDLYSANSVAYSPAGEVEAQVVDGGIGRPEELGAVGGKIALIKRGELRFAEKAANAASAGAVGVILFNDSPGNVYASLFSTASIPAVMLSGEEGESLRSLVASEAVIAHLRVDGSVEAQIGRNVIARRQGTSGLTVVVGAHYDSVPNGPGANDNASGTAVLLETAGVLAARDYPHSLEFVAFDAEEIGLIGSGYYVSELGAEQRESLYAMINLDMLSVGDQLQFAGSEELVAEALRLSEQNGWSARTLEGALRGTSDHANFLAIGVLSVFIYRSNDPRYHSPLDLVEYVPAENLQAAGTLALGLLDFLASG